MKYEVNTIINIYSSISILQLINVNNESDNRVITNKINTSITYLT